MRRTGLIIVVVAVLIAGALYAAQSMDLMGMMISAHGG